MKLIPNEDYAPKVTATKKPIQSTKSTATNTTTKITSKKDNEEITENIQPNKQLGKLVDNIFTALNNELKEDNEIFQNDKETVIRKTSKGKEIILKAKLFPYQKQGLQFLKNNEAEDNDVKGGLLCDEMGLGKTIQIISLLLARPYSIVRNKMDDEDLPMGIKKQTKATLIVSPVSTLDQWQKEIEKFTKDIKIGFYYSKQRNLKDVEDYDVILTTFGTISAEYAAERDPSKKKKYAKKITLSKVYFHRIVLDEAHQIKNINARVTKACLALTSRNKWALTGTPVQNTLMDLEPLLRFVGLQFERPWFVLTTSKIENKKYANTETGKNAMDKLTLLLKPLLLRRTKATKIEGTDQCIVSLPPFDLQFCTVKFPEKENQFYEKLKTEAKETLKLYMRGEKEYTCVLEHLLRLRQVCDHYYLPLSSKVHERDVDFKDLNSNFDKVLELTSTKPLPKENVIDLLEEDDKETEEEDDYKEDDEEKEDEEQDYFKGTKKFINLGEMKYSAKMNTLVEQLKQMKEGDKAVIYSQFTSFLTLLGFALIREKLEYERLDGTMTQIKRAAAIENFKKNLKVNIFLISLKAGGVGLNLTEANKLWLIDPWWNPAIDRQAIERVYRLGQKRNVQVLRLIMEGSIEEKIIELQKKKEALSEGVLSFDVSKLSKLTKKDVEMLLS
eukprot:TRINITY_DN3809_c0_g1_i2.p1 TRINITY_DN3809_c0_g1~~TRINITY_DN3809_c0_g1_i2.p1  ORF type:complete len:672 (+),score=231.22 TRINITY_DN3809_c0_g1_i2:113-2128(+)